MAASGSVSWIVGKDVLRDLDETRQRLLASASAGASFADMAREEEEARLARVKNAIACHIDYGSTVTGKTPRRPRVPLSAKSAVAICFVELTPSDRGAEAWADLRGTQFLQEVASFDGGQHAFLRASASATLHIVPEPVRRSDLSDELVDTFVSTFCALVAALEPVVLVGMGAAYGHLVKLFESGKLGRTHIASMECIVRAPPMYYAFETADSSDGVPNAMTDPVDEKTAQLHKEIGDEMQRRFNAVRARFCSTIERPVLSPERLAMWESYVQEMAEGNGIVPAVMNANLKLALKQLVRLVPERLSAINALGRATFFDRESYAARARGQELQAKKGKALARPARANLSEIKQSIIAEHEKIIGRPTAASLLMPVALSIDEDVAALDADSVPITTLKRTRAGTATQRKLAGAAKMSKSLDAWAVSKLTTSSKHGDDKSEDTDTPTHSDEDG